LFNFQGALSFALQKTDTQSPSDKPFFSASFRPLAPVLSPEALEHNTKPPLLCQHLFLVFGELFLLFINPTGCTVSFFVIMTVGLCLIAALPLCVVVENAPVRKTEITTIFTIFQFPFSLRVCII
jgi:hypothetical protein